MKQSVLNWLIFASLSIIWGSSFILMKEGLRLLSPYQVAAIRVFSAGIVLLPFAFKGWKELTRLQLRLVILSGFLGTFFPAFLFCLAETKIDSALAGILNALTPLFVIVVGIFYFRSRISRLKWTGIIIGFTGMVLLVLSKGRLDFHNFTYSLFILLATFCYGLNVNLVGHHLHHVRSLKIASMSFAAWTIPALLILFISGYFQLSKDHLFFRSSSASAVLGVFGTAIATVLFYVLLKKAGAVFSSMVTYVIPVIAIGWGILAGETITFVQVICFLAILFGVYLVNKKNTHRKEGRRGP